MGDRFYFQQLSKRKRKVAWDDERKAQAVEMYEAESPTPETSMEIVKAIADEMSESPNGVRMILTKAGVYVKKSPATGSAKNGGGSGNSRVSKAAAPNSEYPLEDSCAWWETFLLHVLPFQRGK